MSVIDRDKLLEDLHRSGLVEPERLSKFLAELEPEVDPELLLQKLVEAGVLTSWHVEGLRAGKWKGFFLGKYKILWPLGTGGMGSVYLAEHKVMRHRVAIKVLARHLLSTPNIVARFEQEARAAAVIHHPNVVRAFDIDSEGNNHFLVMEYVQGQDLRKLVEEKGPLDPRVAADYTRQVANGLDAAHRSGMIHRDIKPANLLLDQSGLVKVLDLGLARLDDEAASVSMSGESQVLGTVDYLAPEQARNSHNIDGRADLYSLGCTLYFLLTGLPPFPTGSVAERMLKHQTRRPLDIRKRRPGIPDSLVNICSRLMEKQPDKRYATAAEAAEALTDFLEGRSDVHQQINEDDLLTFAEDSDTGSNISRKTSPSSSNASRATGGSSTASARLPSSSTLGGEIELAPDVSSSKSLSKPIQPTSTPPQNVSPTLDLAPVLAPLGSSTTGLPPPSPSGVTNPASLGVQPPNLDQRLPPHPFGEPGTLQALPSLGDNLAELDPFAGGPLGAPLGSARPHTQPQAEVYPLWKLIAIGVGLGLLVAAAGFVIYVVM